MFRSVSLYIGAREVKIIVHDCMFSTTGRQGLKDGSVNVEVKGTVPHIHYLIMFIVNSELKATRHLFLNVLTLYHHQLHPERKYRNNKYTYSSSFPVKKSSLSTPLMKM